jgi:hypothetical protein
MFIPKLRRIAFCNSPAEEKIVPGATEIPASTDIPQNISMSIHLIQNRKPPAGLLTSVPFGKYFRISARMMGACCAAVERSDCKCLLAGLVLRWTRIAYPSARVQPTASNPLLLFTVCNDDEGLAILLINIAAIIVVINPGRVD